MARPLREDRRPLVASARRPRVRKEKALEGAKPTPLSRTQIAVLKRVATAARARRSPRDGSARVRQPRAAIVVLAGAAARGTSAAIAVLAAETGRSVYRVDLSQVVSQYIGETEKNLARVFARADAAAVVLVMDEADSLFGRRSDTSDDGSGYTDLAVGYALGRLDVFEGAVVVASSAPTATLHPSLVERVRWTIDFSRT